MAKKKAKKATTKKAATKKPAKKKVAAKAKKVAPKKVASKKKAAPAPARETALPTDDFGGGGFDDSIDGVSGAAAPPHILEGGLE